MKSKSLPTFHEIKLLPSLWTLDVLISNDNEANIKAFIDRYGLETHNFEGRCMNEVYTIVSSKTSVLKGETRIVLVLESLEEKHIIAHDDDRIFMERN